MPESTVQTGLGVKLSRAGVEIAYITDVGGVSIKQKMIDISNMQSPNDAEEFIGGRLSGGSVSLKGWFKPGDTNGQVGLHADALAHTKQAFVLTYDVAAATTWTFTALVEEFTITGVNLDNAIEFTASLKISGLPVLGITASAGLTALTGINFAVAALVFTPVFATAKLLYSVPVITTSTHIHLTPTGAGTITITCLGVSQVVPTTSESAAITIGAADSFTEVTIMVAETGKAPVEYSIFVARAAA